MSDDVRRVAAVAGVVIGGVFTVIGGLLCYMWGLRGPFMVGGAIGIGIVVGWLVRSMSLGIAVGAGRSMLAFVQPSGKSSPYQQEFSQGQALAAADNIDGAIEWYDAEMARLPESVVVRIQSADLHARNGRPERAESLFLEARRLTSDRTSSCTAPSGSSTSASVRSGRRRAPSPNCDASWSAFRIPAKLLARRWRWRASSRSCRGNREDGLPYGVSPLPFEVGTSQSTG